ncbi:DNA excision repair protein ERCC-1 [Blattella germanica]|nr:DNA excision repair protein ERCC-1 [Blattella germanica]
MSDCDDPGFEFDDDYEVANVIEPLVKPGTSIEERKPVDSKDPHHALKNLTRISLLTDVTLMLAWSPEEAGRIIETYKIFEHKPPDMIMESQKCGPYLKLVNALTSVRSVNKTDATSLLRTFGSFEKIVRAPSETLGLCPGFGLQKAARLHNVLHQSFLREKPATGKMKSSSKK